MRVEDLMEAAEPFSCRCDASLRHAAREMERGHCDSLTVVDDRQRVLGIVTRFDVDAALLRWRRRAGSPRVSEVLRRSDPVHPDDSLEAALQRMADLGISRVAVVAEDGRLRGTVARQRISGALGA